MLTCSANCPLLNYQISGKIWTVQEVLNLYKNPTQYEKEAGITQTRWQILEDHGDVKFFTNTKSDRTKTLLILHRQGLSKNWVGWMISELQAHALIEDFPRLYCNIEEMNRRRRPA